MMWWMRVALYSLLMMILLLAIPLQAGMNGQTESNYIVYMVRWNPDDTRLAAGRNDGIVSVYNSQLELLHDFEMPFWPDRLAAIGLVEWSSQSPHLIALGLAFDYRFLFPYLLHTETGEVERLLPARELATVVEMRWHPTLNRLVISGSYLSPQGDYLRESTEIWDMTTQTLICSTADGAFGLHWTPDELVIGINEGIRVVDNETCQEKRFIPIEFGINRVMAANPAVTMVAISTFMSGIHVVGTYSQLWIVDFQSGQLVVSDSQFDAIGALSWSPDGRYLAIEERGLRLYDVQSAKIVETLDAPNGTLLDLVWHPSWPAIAYAVIDSQAGIQAEQLYIPPIEGAIIPEVPIPLHTTTPSPTLPPP